MVTFDDVKQVMFVLCDSVCRRMREQGFMAKTVCIYIRDNELMTLTRQHTMDTHTNLTKEITKAAMELFRKSYKNI